MGIRLFTRQTEGNSCAAACNKVSDLHWAAAIPLVYLQSCLVPPQLQSRILWAIDELQQLERQSSTDNPQHAAFVLAAVKQCARSGNAAQQIVAALLSVVQQITTLVGGRTSVRSHAAGWGFGPRTSHTLVLSPPRRSPKPAHTPSSRHYLAYGCVL